jgi:hyperosmotically inducible periplasmic protein
MRSALRFLVLTALFAYPAVSAAQSATTPATTPAPATDSSGGTLGVKDSWITSKAKMKLVADKRTKARQIKVETQSGVVTLRGKVASGDERSAAEEITKGVDGVKSVRNTLEVVPEMKRKAADTKDDEITKSVRDRLAADEQLKSTTIRVRADNGMVTLMGTVPTVKVKDRAAELARKTPGVRAVRNELQLKV